MIYNERNAKLQTVQRERGLLYIVPSVSGTHGFAGFLILYCFLIIEDTLWYAIHNNTVNASDFCFVFYVLHLQPSFSSRFVFVDLLLRIGYCDIKRKK